MFLVYLFVFALFHKPDDEERVYARCYGYTPCNACSSCNYCAYCNNGGTCGICAPRYKTAPREQAPSGSGGTSKKPIYYSKTVQVKVNEANVRTGPGTNYRSVGTYGNGVLIEIDGKLGTWYFFTYEGSRYYIHSSTVK